MFAVYLHGGFCQNITFKIFTPAISGYADKQSAPVFIIIINLLKTASAGRRKQHRIQW